MPIVGIDAQGVQRSVGAVVAIEADGTRRNCQSVYDGRRKVFSATALPHISSVALLLRDSSQATITPDATGTENGITVQSYRETSFNRAHDVRITADYTGADRDIRCTRRTPTVDDVNIPSISTSTTQAVFQALTQFTPELRNDYRVSVSNIQGDDHHSIDLQYWSQPTAAITSTSDTTVGSGGLSYTELYLTVTRGGEPKPTVSLTASDGSHVPNVTRAFQNAERAAGERRDSVELQHISRVVTGTDRSVTYTFTVSNNVPGGTALTASANLVFVFP